MGTKLKMLRESAKMSQSELERLSGVSRQTIIAIENGERVDIKLSTLKMLASALNVHIADIYP